MPSNTLNIISKKAKGKSSQRPPIVFIHGSWHGAWCWDEYFLDYFTAKGFDVHAPNLRGRGGSPLNKKLHWVRANDFVNDIISVVEGLDQQPVIIGHSNGGYLAQLCLHRSENIKGVGLIATVPHYGTFPVTMKVAAKRPIDFAKVNLFWTMYPLVKDPFKAKKFFLEENVSDEETIGFGKKLVDEAYWAYLDSMVFNLPKKYHGSTPVTVIGGGKDTMFSVASQKATAHRYNAKCHIVDGAPHNLMLSSQWRETADRLVSWIDNEL